eukprot:CAMPEP_0198214782 /NCGR_PEP_ID=MMETSP1445-20131203/43999_1 /TAXON_ID=36898 /ORGANISM="Pyramimonas sp., Strain CCMP2087" /LENGTH=121 /DNA_ID=CAMNT_0043890109 /DNA_START=113 /DNA_END=478 /DNA_ORIENTATION=-
MPPKTIWWQRGDAVQESEVIAYAFVVLKKLYPRKGTRKRGREETVDLDETLPTVSDMYETSAEWWEDIAKALSSHEATKNLIHLHSANGLMNWFVKKRKDASFDRVRYSAMAGIRALMTST